VFSRAVEDLYARVLDAARDGRVEP